MSRHPGFPRRTALAALAAAPFLLPAAAFAQAAEWPARPVTWVNPFAAGSAVDVVARIIAQKVAANTKPFLLQTYRRDMGGGSFVLMKDLSAPIHIHGRHWGAFRMGYRQG
jgi:hypothetical protein